MIFIAKIIILNGFWFGSVLHGSQGYGLYYFLLALVLLAINYFVVKKVISLQKYLLMTLMFWFYGVLQDGLLIYFDVMAIDSSLPPLWLTALWLVFLGYFGDLLDKFRNLAAWQLAIPGAVGGVMAYYGGANLGGILINHIPAYLASVAVSWAIFFPLSIKVFYSHYKT